MPEKPLVGIVVVSHSAPLAHAAVELAREMLHDADVRVEVAAGLDEHTLGTDAMKIHDALLAADTGAGVVVLMDLGSALLSAELAVDLLGDDARGRVLLCPAPLVEGLVVAVVAAAGGADRHAVAAEAVGGLAGKQAHLRDLAGAAPAGGGNARPTGARETVLPTDAGTPLSGTFIVSNPHGLHARPAARLVQEVSLFGADVVLRNLTTGSGPVAASSLSRVATLGARCGHEVQVSTSGVDARDALDQVLALAVRGFDELETAVQSPPGGARPEVRPAPAPTGARPASPGIGIGPVWRLDGLAIEVPDTRTSDPAGERQRLDDAITEVRGEISSLRERTAAEVGDHDAAIFDAHLLFLSDADLLSEAGRRIDAGQAAAPAWAAAVARVEAEFAALDDPYLRDRAADVRAVGDQVLRVLLDLTAPVTSGVGVLVAGDLAPAEVACLDPARVAAVVLAAGSPTAHAAILARAKGIPVVVAAGERVLDLPTGTLVAVDGSTGEIVARPSAEDLDRFRLLAEQIEEVRAVALARSGDDAITSDGNRVLVGANVGSIEDAVLAAGAGADLAGLVRTEFLFLGRDRAPDVDEQVESYLALAEALGGRRLTLRTLDVGGDKPLGYVPMPHETNPFLGVRGLRLSLARPGLLADQLLAVVRTAHQTPVSLMFPMVSTVDELREARTLLDEAVARAGRASPAGLKVGIMVEVPATALKAAAFAPLVDFFSIGTNDLTQYALAAERGNGAVAALGDPYDPGVLRLVQNVCDGAGGALVAVCGELAADPLAAPLLVGMGVQELSMSPLSIAEVKQAVRSIDTGVAKGLAARALGCEGPDAVRALLAGGGRE